MMDHETFVLLAAKRISEPLTADEEAELEAHLATCPDCRAIAAGMRRDDMRLRAELGAAKVSPRVRHRVLDEAYGRRQVDRRLILALAATLLLAAIGVPLLAGARLVPAPSPTIAPPAETPPATTLAVTPSPAPSLSIASPSPSEPVPSPSPVGIAPFVAGAYTYGNPSRRDAVAAHFDGGAVGEWSRTIPATGSGTSFGGPVTCLVISGADAWLAGPATTATDGSKDRSAFIHVHDGGRNGKGDSAILWMNNPGQTLATMTGWCETKFIPGGPFPVTSGDVVVKDGRK